MAVNLIVIAIKSPLVTDIPVVLFIGVNLIPVDKLVISSDSAPAA